MSVIAIATETELTWTARTMRPVIILYLAAVFAAFMLAAHFVFRSPAAVKALAGAAFTSIVALVPGLLARREYRLDDNGLARRPRGGRRPKDFTSVFGWAELSRLVPTRTGFKYTKVLHERRRLARFAKLHLTDGYAGEIHVEDVDRERVRSAFVRRGVRVAGTER